MSWDSTVVDSPSGWGEWATVSMVGERCVTLTLVALTLNLTLGVTAAVAAADVFDFILDLDEVKCI